MRKTILLSLTIGFSFKLAVYFIGALAMWSFYNPIAWVETIPDWEPMGRIGVLIWLVLDQLANYHIAKNLQKPKDEQDFAGPLIMYIMTICLLGIILGGVSTGEL